MLAELFPKAGIGLHAPLEGDKGDQSLSLDLIGPTHHRCFSYLGMADQGTLNLGGTNAMA